MSRKFGDRGGSDYGAPREMHNAKCADCGKECQVPFKPTEGKPVYCGECYKNHRKPRY
jgi:CxxC-x17-CxxC domain-containing protein